MLNYDSIIIFHIPVKVNLYLLQVSVIRWDTICWCCHLWSG